MRPAEIGFVLPALEDPPTGKKPTWDEIGELAVQAESLGFDTVWVPDELYWKHPDWPAPRGFWECVALTAAVAATTSSIKVGTWVLSALHRNAGLTAKVADTIDEISGGRFIFGLGAGHAGSQGAAFGFPADKTISRYEEALEIIVPLLRQSDEITFEGEFHRVDGLASQPKGPRPGGIPLMLAGHGPRTVGLAVEHGDIWSAYATESSLAADFEDRFRLLEEVCSEKGRESGSIGKSVGVFVETPGTPVKAEDVGLGVPLRGTADEVAERVHDLAALGATMIELNPFPEGREGIEFAGAVLDVLDG